MDISWVLWYPVSVLLSDSWLISNQVLKQSLSNCVPKSHPWLAESALRWNQTFALLKNNGTLPNTRVCQPCFKQWSMGNFWLWFAVILSDFVLKTGFGELLTVSSECKWPEVMEEYWSQNLRIRRSTKTSVSSLKLDLMTEMTQMTWSQREAWKILQN